MKTKILRCSLAGLICLALLLPLTSCWVKHDEAEVAAAAAELIEASYELNDIYFGEGLPYDKTSVQADIEDYYPVAEGSTYKTEEALREATLKVYSEEYSDFLFEKAFKGFSVTFDEGDMTTPEIIYARYLSDNSGFMVRDVTGEKKLKLDRTYDMATIEMTDATRDTATVTVKSLVNGKADVDVELTLVKTDAGWRLDTPTY